MPWQCLLSWKKLLSVENSGNLDLKVFFVHSRLSFFFFGYGAECCEHYIQGIDLQASSSFFRFNFIFLFVGHEIKLHV